MTSSADAAGHERAAVRAYLLGGDDDSAEHWEAALIAARTAGDSAEAARFAFWLGLGLMLRGQEAPASGWFSRARELITEAGVECPASGYALIPEALAALDDDPRSACDIAVRATDVGTRFGDPDLRALGTLAHGQALIAAGEPVAGVARLDNVMVSVMADELSPITSGVVYCAVILECMDLFDLRRASEWTNALAAWCDSRPDLVPFRGQCLVHKSQLEQATGEWPAALASAQSACVRLRDPPHPALGLAYYQAGELYRLVGDFEQAEQNYRHAARHGHDPVPGLALLHVARGDCSNAVVTIRRAMEEQGAAVRRASLLSAAVEIFREGGDLAAARLAADELSNLAGLATSTVIEATAAQADGSVLLASGDLSAALHQLRTAARLWQSHCMPYDAARTAVLLGLVCAAMGDRTSAELEFDGAKDVFTRLGAGPDLNRVTALALGLARGGREHLGQAALSAREQQVLVHLAAGRSNREIAEKLVVSPHTVARHIEHIYTKLGVTNRAAATAYAYEHDLI